MILDNHNLAVFIFQMQCGVKEIAVFGSASEMFSKRNINCSIDESLERFSQVVATALANNIRVRGYISCVVGCPYEGSVPPHMVTKVREDVFYMNYKWFTFLNNSSFILLIQLTLEVVLFYRQTKY